MATDDIAVQVAQIQAVATQAIIADESGNLRTQIDLFMQRLAA